MPSDACRADTALTFPLSVEEDALLKVTNVPIPMHKLLQPTPTRWAPRHCALSKQCPMRSAFVISVTSTCKDWAVTASTGGAQRGASSPCGQHAPVCTPQLLRRPHPSDLPQGWAAPSARDAPLQVTTSPLHRGPGALCWHLRPYLTSEVIHFQISFQISEVFL